MAHVIGVMSVTVLWMHAWSIPGSVILVSQLVHMHSNSSYIAS